MTTTQRSYIADWQPNQLVEGLFAIQNAQLGLTRNGKPFLKCLIADKTGRLPARMWNASEELVNQLPTDGFVMLEGQTQPYQGQLQLIVQSISAATPSPDDLPHLLPSTENDVERMFSELSEIVRSVGSPSLRALVETYLQDKKLMGAFKQCPAAQSLHHAFLGGLLEHTLHLLKLADAMLPQFPHLNRDLVITGLFIHDIGKCSELAWREGFQYTDEGQLVGHIVRGSTWLHQKAAVAAKSGHALSRPALLILEHIILSHHSKPEFGAARTPSTPEALFVALLDNLEAKMQMAVQATRGSSAPDPASVNGNFTDRMWALDNVRLYRPDPMADEAEGNAAPDVAPDPEVVTGSTPPLYADDTTGGSEKA